MAEITRKRTGEFLLGLFNNLIKAGGPIKAADAIVQLRNQFSLTEYEKGIYPSGGMRFDKIVRFATVDCVKAGWMEKHKGHWVVTDLGKEAIAKFKDPEEFYREALRLYHAWRNSSSDETLENKATGQVEEEEAAAAITFEQADEQAWEQIESHLGRLPPYDFQHLVAGLLKAMGYHIAWVAPPGKDGGVDIIANQDPLGTKPPRVKVQVKRQQQPVSIDGLRTFMALLGEGDIGVFVSLGGFTKDSQESARYQESRRVTLIDSEKLTDLWIEHFGKLEEEYKSLFRLKPIYFLAPQE